MLEPGKVLESVLVPEPEQVPELVPEPVQVPVQVSVPVRHRRQQ